jgi:AMP phosphorylase
MLKLNVISIDLITNFQMAVLNEQDAKDLGILPNDRIKLSNGTDELILIVDITKKLVKKGTIGLNSDCFLSKIKENDAVRIEPIERPLSVEYIKKKLSGKELSKDECRQIIRDINDNRLSSIEMGAYVAAVYTHDFNMKELFAIVDEMVNTGRVFKWDSEFVVDKHSIGGVPGNRITPIIVSIVSAAGLIIPKTSSRAITSPAGTADTMEVWCDVNFSIDQIMEIVKKTGSCFVWGGAVDMAPTDDKIIKAEYPLSLDPEGQLIASVMAKKIAMGAKYLVIDIPFGPQTKVDTLYDAEALAIKFKKVAQKFNIKCECTLTRGDQPIGLGMGPTPEAIDILNVLNGNGPDDLREKSLDLAGILLKLTKKGNRDTAQEILDSGQALKKFKEIVIAQNGNPNKDLQKMLGKHKAEFKAKTNGHITEIRNKELTQISRLAGAPNDIGSGIILKKKLNNLVKKGDTLFEIYAHQEFKLKNALKLSQKYEPIKIEQKEKILVKEV